MTIKDESFFKTLKNYLTIYLTKQKCYSVNTIKSYKETFKILLKFLEEKKLMMKWLSVTFKE